MAPRSVRRKGISASRQQQLHAARAVRRRGRARGTVQRRPLRGVAVLKVRRGIQKQRQQIQPGRDSIQNFSSDVFIDFFFLSMCMCVCVSIFYIYICIYIYII